MLCAAMARASSLAASTWAGSLPGAEPQYTQILVRGGEPGLMLERVEVPEVPTASMVSTQSVCFCGRRLEKGEAAGEVGTGGGSQFVASSPSKCIYSLGSNMERSTECDK